MSRNVCTQKQKIVYLGVLQTWLALAAVSCQGAWRLTSCCLPGSLQVIFPLCLWEEGRFRHRVCISLLSEEQHTLAVSFFPLFFISFLLSRTSALCTRGLPPLPLLAAAYPGGVCMCACATQSRCVCVCVWQISKASCNRWITAAYPSILPGGGPGWQWWQEARVRRHELE